MVMAAPLRVGRRDGRERRADESDTGDRSCNLLSHFLAPSGK
jgi:hypothetical protein